MNLINRRQMSNFTVQQERFVVINKLLILLSCLSFFKETKDINLKISLITTFT